MAPWSKLALLALGALTASNSLADTFYVNGAVGNDSWNGRCEVWDGGNCGPKRTIQSGINAAMVAGDTVQVANGTYRGAGNVNLVMPVRTISLISDRGPDFCTIDAELTANGIQSFGNGNQSTVEGFTFVNVQPFGVGLYASAGTPTIRNCIFRGNRDSAVFAVNQSNSVVVQDCRFEQNERTVDNASQLISFGGASTVSDCVFVSNISSTGAPVLAPANGRMIRCAFNKNASNARGGALQTLPGRSLLLEDCEFLNNAADFGGAVYFEGVAPATMRNCLFVGNQAAFEGGASWTDGRQLLVSNCNFVGNAAGQRGGALYFTRVSTDLQHSISNSIFVSNNSQIGANISIVGSPTRLLVDHCCIPDGLASIDTISGGPLTWGVQNIETTPSFAFPAGDYRLMADSPCIDAGNPAAPGGLAVLDHERIGRILDGDGDSIAIPDIGAYEFDRDRPRIALAAERLEYFVSTDGPDFSEAIPLIRSTGGPSLSWSINTESDWLIATPTNGDSSGEADAVVLSAATSSFTPGRYQAQLVVSGTGALNTPRTIEVVVNVTTNRRVPSQYSSIQAAVAAATDGDTIELETGTYSGPQNRSILLVDKILTFAGTGSTPSQTVIDGENVGRLFEVHTNNRARSVRFENLTIFRGSANQGAGVRVDRGAAAFHNCMLDANQVPLPGSSTTNGSAVYVFRGSLTLENSTVSNNAAASNGAIYLRDSGFLIANCEFRGNLAQGNGAALALDRASGSLTTCTFLSNASVNSGGALFDQGGSAVELEYCLFQNNSSNALGSACSATTAASSVFRDCTFLQNPAFNSVVSVAGIHKFERCVFSGLPGGPSQVALEIPSNSGARVHLEACTFAAGFQYGLLTRGGGFLTARNCLWTGSTIHHVLNSDGANMHFVGCEFTQANANVAIRAQASFGEAILALISCKIHGNSAGVRLGNNIRARIENCIFTNQQGGDILNFDSFLTSLDVTNCTVIGRAGGADPMIYISSQNPTSIDNSIIWRPSSPAARDIETSSQAQLTVTHSILRTAWAGAGNIAGDPMLSTSDCGLIPLPGSPAIDGGDNSALPSDLGDLDDDEDTVEQAPFDFAGNARRIDDPLADDQGNGQPPVVDIGAFEFQRLFGDLDGDYDVDLNDLARLLGSFQESNGGDTDFDGDTDLQDLANLLAEFGASC